ncbi:MAG: hypothetical protein WAN65_30545 [Candidatus Sulfotelmatobacter sp.]
MAKVVTSAGIRDFVLNGKTEDMKPPEKPEVVPDKPVEVKAEEAPKEGEYIDDDKETQAEIEKSERFRKTINKKHRAMKEAQEAAAEAEEFARSQWNEARLAKERASALEERMKELQAQAKKPEPEVKKPTHDEVVDGKKRFYDDQGQFKAFEYAEALATFAANEAVANDRKRQIEEAQTAQAAIAEEAAKAHVAESRKVHADYDEVINNADVKTHSQVLQYMTGSEHIAEIAYYLAKNPDYVERLNKLNPLKAIAEIGKLELTFEKPKPVPETPVPKVSGAPAPIVPLQTNSSGIVQTDPAKMGFKELRAYEAQRAAAKRR